MIRALGQIAGLFLKLGTISFGGPAVHIELMERETVERRGWVSREHFFDLLGATHLIPGPNAVEMANHLGYCRGGLPGSLVGGLCFTLPAVIISTVIAVAYVRYGTLAEVQPVLGGIRPAVLAIIFAAVWRLGRKSLKTWQLLLIGTAVAATSLAGVDEIAALLLGSLIGVLLLRFSRPGAPKPEKTTAAMLTGATTTVFARGAQAATIASAPLSGAACGATATAVSLGKLGWFFLKVSALLYGGGYVLLAYIEGELVGDPWGLSEQQLIDAVTVGQLTPGPLLSTVTFVGYVVAGYSGAAVATLGFLLPSFVLVAAVNPLIPRLRQSIWASRFLDAVTAASIGLMAAVTVTLARATLLPWQEGVLKVDVAGVCIALVAAAIALRWKVAPAWLVLAGAVAGWIFL